MKRITKLCLGLITSLTLTSGFGQSNTPCNGAGAPLISVGTSCNLSTVSITGSATAQTNAANGGVPGCGIIGQDVWFSFTAPAIGGVNLFTQSGSITDAVMAVYSGPCGSLNEIACSDDVNGLMPEISIGNLIPGDTYYIRLWEFAGGTGSFQLCVTEANVISPTNTDCTIPYPICSGSPILFTAAANGTQAATIDPGNDYDCLFTSPNPSWYYLEIDQGGNLSIDITAPEDVDFAIWGPYADLTTAIANCNAYPDPLDCSFSPSEIEQANVSNVQAGEVYILLITNFANTVQMISVNDSPTNTALTDCSIVLLPVELVNFQGKRSPEGVELSWLTATETSNDYFAVERSTDAVNWMTFDIINGQGTTSSSTQYELTDRNAPKELTYYRLKQFDFNGTVNYSDVIAVSEKMVSGLRVHPNPSSAFFLVEAESEIQELVVSNSQGREVYVRDNLTTESVTVDVTEFDSGVYFVRVKSEGQVLTARVVIV